MKLIIILIVLSIIVYVIINQKKKKPNLLSTEGNNFTSSPEISNTSQMNDNNSESDYLDNYWIAVESKKRELKLALFIKYKNTRSIISEREFDLDSFSRGEKGYHLHGYCHNKKRNITLSSLGVMGAKNISTGEVIHDIIKFIENNYKSTIYYKQDLLFDDYGWAIYVLLYLSATSGSVIKKERDVIITFIKSIKGFEELSEEWFDKTLKELYRPGKMEIRNWIKEGMSKNYNFELLLPWIDMLDSLQSESNKEFQNLKNYVLRQLQEFKK
jgi:hypothetical protein